VRPPRRVVGALALAGALAVLGAVQLARASAHLPSASVRAALEVWVVAAYVSAGLIAWWRRPRSRLGPLMVAAGFVLFLTCLSWANAPLLFTVGAVVDLLPAVLFLHVYLAFPDGRLVRPLDRALVAAGYAAALGLQLIGLALDGFGPDNVLALSSRPDAAATVQRTQLLVLSGLLVIGSATLVQRGRGEGRPLRRSLQLLVNAFVVALVVIAFLLASAALGFAEGQSAFETLRRLAYVAIGLAPVVWVLALLEARLARSAVSDLVVTLGGGSLLDDLRGALAHALRDPSVRLAFWLQEFSAYADADGRPVALPDGDPRRAVTVIERSGTPVAAIVHDPSLADEPELLEGVAAAAGIALENARLQAELRARVEEVRGSRARILEAGQKERQRLERNLHDGAQQRLVALSLELGLIERDLSEGADAGERLVRARQEIAASLAELREIARGIHPAVVTGHGLAVALEQAAALAPLPVRLSVDVEGRLPEAIEVAAYYLVCESLANVGKHAQATSATVSVGRTAARVAIEVTDDGVGGADTERGSGLRGLADRVEALGGTLRVWSPAGAGTRVRAEIPCAA
jgi:signal transduction histidine kinase